jgi:hypothetical protein
MNKFYSRLGWFCAGVLVGATGTFLYQIWQGGPKVEKRRLDFLYEMSDNDLDDVIYVIWEQMQG